MKRIIILSLILLSLFSCKKNENEFDATGVFETDEILISSEVAGRILNFEAQEGTEISKFQSLGLIDTIQLSLQKTQLEAGIVAIEARKQDIETQTSSIKEQINIQETEKARVEKLIAADLANTKALDEINYSIALLKKQLSSTTQSLQSANKSADAEILAKKIHIKQIDDMIMRCNIISPINGVVLVKYANEGELTAAGKPLLKIADIKNMEIRAYIIYEQLKAVKIGQKVKIHVDADKTYDGEITWISDKAEFTPKTIQTKDERENLVYAIKVAFENDGYAKIGMYGDIDFQ